MMLNLRALLVGVALCLSCVGPVSAHALAACDGPAAVVLHPAAQPASDARAYWLDAGILRWPGKPLGGHYRLLASAHAGLRIQPGGVATGIDRSLPLLPAGALPADVASRFRFTGPGVELQLATEAASALPQLLQGQLLLVQEDAAGRVLDATHVQHPGALDVLYADADGENAALAKTAAEQQELLRKVQLQKGLYEMALREMRKAESEMAASMQRQTPGTTTRSATTILQLKGQLPPPLWGEVVRRFQQTGDSDDPTFANGITIKTPPKTEVYAVHDGTVLFAGTMRGYGNVVIIDHRNHYFSVSARLEQMRVRQGATISKGQMIGTSGRHSDHPAEGLYFEIRRDAEAEDPLLWLRPGSLSLP